MALFEELAAVAVGISLILSTVLFSVEVFIKGRGPRGQGLGFFYSLVTLPLYFIVFCDRFPGHPTGARNILLILPGVTKADTAFNSSVAILILLVLTYALRLGIYTRLFIIPALTMTEAEYRSRGQVESRANDLSAPILAYLAFALVLTAALAGAYALPVAAGAVICVCLLILYFVYPFLRQLEKSVLWLVVQFRITVRALWLYASRLVVQIIVFLGKAELWRRRTVPEDELFIRRLEARQRESEAKAREKIRLERKKLEKLA